MNKQVEYHIGERTVLIDEGAESRYRAALEKIKERIEYYEDAQCALNDIDDIVTAAIVPKKVSQSEQADCCWCGKELIVCSGMPDFPGDDITKPGHIGTCWYECPAHGINYVFQDGQL